MRGFRLISVLIKVSSAKNRLVALKCGSDVHTSHGFKATASTHLNASGRFSIDAIERSLAHQDKDAVRRAYARGDAMKERGEMAQWWADYLDTLWKRHVS